MQVTAKINGNAEFINEQFSIFIENTIPLVTTEDMAKRFINQTRPDVIKSIGQYNELYPEHAVDTVYINTEHYLDADLNLKKLQFIEKHPDSFECDESKLNAAQAELVTLLGVIDDHNPSPEQEPDAPAQEPRVSNSPTKPKFPRPSMG